MGRPSPCLAKASATEFATQKMGVMVTGDKACLNSRMPLIVAKSFHGLELGERIQDTAVLESNLMKIVDAEVYKDGLNTKI